MCREKLQQCCLQPIYYIIELILYLSCHLTWVTKCQFYLLLPTAVINSHLTSCFSSFHYQHHPKLAHSPQKGTILISYFCSSQKKREEKAGKMKVLFATLLLCILLLSSSFLEPAMAKPLFCAKQCKARCAKAGVKDRCLKYCGICCAQCKCVPSGTYGNKHECPCYRDLRNNKGKPKCP